MNYKGSCHCGRIAFAVDGDFDRVIDCNCSHCSRKGYLLWFVPREKLELATPESDLSTTRSTSTRSNTTSARHVAARRLA